MTDQLKNILIGLFVAIAITICVSMILFLEPNVGDGKKILKVRFANVSGICIGTRVTFGGKVVGEVSSIKEVPNARDLSIDESGKVYLYQLTLKLDSGVKMYSTDEVAIRTSGLMGERSIAILPKVTPKGATPILITSEVLYANSIDPMENTINQMGKVAVNAQSAIIHFDEWFQTNSTGLSQMVASLNESAKNVVTISENIAHGNGTVGKFINSDDFYLRLSSLTGKVETLMHDVNHYGILFQYDKTWQRQRTKRATAIKSLETPTQFRDYFEGEVSTIQSSLGRINELLERASDAETRQKIIQSEPFKKDFGSLQRQVQALSESIKLYNEELIVKDD